MSLIKSAPVLCATLAPHQVSFAWRQGTRFIEEGSWHQACDNPDGSWQNALMLLRTGLQQSKQFPAGSRLSVSLAGRWCQMLRMPWSDALLQAETGQRFLHNQFIAIFGEVAREWQIEVDDAPYGQARLACALETGLLHALQELAESFSLRLQSLEPLLAQAWRALARMHGKQCPAFALIEEERITLAQTHRGHIQQVHTEYWRSLAKPAGKPAHWQHALVQSWQRYCLREPHLAEFDQVAVLNLSHQAQREQLPSPFVLTHMASPELAPSFAALICNR